jgi:predicted nuclease of predicted toxin-antitoxin system
VADRPTLFVDRSLGKRVGKRLREAGAAVELHDDHFAQTTEDSVWIPDVTARGWVILTKDKSIRRPRGEREDVLLAAAKVFTLTSGNMSGDEMADLFVERLADIERIAGSQTPPFVYAIGSGVIRQLLPLPTSGPAVTPIDTED